MTFKPKNGDSHSQRLMKLRVKGGIMFFVIERQHRLYKGTIILSAVENCCQERTVYIREYGDKKAKDEARISQNG